jgi:hypothetical protein
MPGQLLTFGVSTGIGISRRHTESDEPAEFRSDPIQDGIERGIAEEGQGGRALAVPGEPVVGQKNGVVDF